MRYLLLSILLLTGSVNSELFVYESFDYEQNILGNNNGGIGFSSGWGNNISGTSMTGSSSMTLSGGDIPGGFGSLFSQGGHVSVADGNSYSAVRILNGLFETDIDLSVDKDYYISFLFRRDDDYNGNIDEWFTFRLYSFAGETATEFLTIGTNSDESIYIDGIGGKIQTPANAFELNKTYLFVIKITAQNRVEPAQSDQVFLKIYEQSNLPDESEMEIDWLLVSGHDEYNSRKADCLQIAGGFATGFCFDELRIGTEWSDVVDISQSETTELKAEEVFDYEVSSKENFDGGEGFNGPWCGTDAIATTEPLDGFVITNLYSLSHHGIKYKPSGGCMTKENGVKGSAFRYLSPRSCIDLDQNEDYYLSFLFRRDDESDSNADEWFILRFYTVEGQSKSEAFSIVFNSDESISIGGLSATDSSPDVFGLNETYFVILKIAAQDDSSPTNYDRIFLKIVATDNTLERTETLDWILSGSAGNNSQKMVNLLQIGADDATGLKIDELRIGQRWEDVVSAGAGGSGNFFFEADISKDYAVDEIDLNYLIEDWLL